MLNEKQYRSEAAATSINVYEDLCRVTEEEVNDMKRRLGWSDDYFTAPPPTAALRALKEFLRARTTALDVKRRASEELAPPSPGA